MCHLIEKTQKSTILFLIITNMNVFNNKKFDNQSFFTAIKANRNYLMGVAMLLVIVFHFFCWVTNPIGKLNIGFIGVDIFLFLSGFGLSYSFEKNGLLDFYKRRIIRIYPTYFLAVTLTYIFVKWSPIQLINNYITIGFYINGGANRYDWYLESLFTLYLLFPVFYFLSKYTYKTLFITFIIVMGLLYAFHDFFHQAWWYNCLVARIPIFIYGIMFKKYVQSLKYVCICCCILSIPCALIVSGFLGISLLAIPLIWGLLKLSDMINISVKSKIEFCGQHSLELYCANCLVFNIIDEYCNSLLCKGCMFLFSQIIISALFIKYGKFVSQIIYKK